MDNGYTFNFDNSVIRNCGFGIFAAHPGQGNSYYRLRGSTIQNIDQHGVEFNQVYAANVSSTTIQNVGRSGLRAINVDQLILNSFDDAPNYEDTTRIRYCGFLNDYMTDPAIYLEETTVTRFNRLQIYENHNQAIQLTQGSTIIGNRNYNKNNLIANNAIGIDSYSNRWKKSDLSDVFKYNRFSVWKLRFF